MIELNEMDIVALEYFLFVFCTALIYWSLKGQKKWIVLLFSSLIFFFINSKPSTVLYMLYSATSVYFGTILLEKRDERKKQIIASAVIISNLAILAVLKYSNLFVDAVNFVGILFDNSEPILHRVSFVAPLAISFYTLQIIGYFIDCYRGEIKPEKNILKLLLFTCYFPMMVSGPICRFNDVQNSLFNNNSFDYQRVSVGIKRIALGLIKKIAIGNRLFSVVSIIDSDISTYSGYYIWISALLYSLYLYMDFSGCMDIISAVSNILGVKLPDNFKAPFFSRSTKEFWRRWHITLGAWLRDYVLDSLLKSRIYINITKISLKKLGRKRGRNLSVYISMLFVWICMGIWHGNGWKYVFGEGLWYWLVIVLGMMFESKFNNLRNALKINANSNYWHVFQSIRTFIIFSVGNLFFKATNLNSAFNQIIKSFSVRGDRGVFSNLISDNSNIRGFTNVSVLLVAILLVLIVDILIFKEKDVFKIIAKKGILARWAVYTLMIALIVLSLGTHSVPFAYAIF